MTASRARRYLSDESGAGAAEFTLVLPVAVAFIFAFTHICLLTYSAGRLHWSAEDAARCASVRAECMSGDPAATDWDLVGERVESSYGGMTTTPALAHPADDCGNKVILTTNYVLNAVIFTETFPLSASACFPA
jgi:Flp pilus assembly pilin Flp